MEADRARARAEPLLPAAETHRKADSQRKLKMAAGLALTFMTIEIVGGMLAHSLAILTDAAHMLSDVAGFLVSLIALSITSRPPDETFSFGYHRAEVLGALFSIFAVWFMTGILVYEAINRLITPQVIEGRIMGVTAIAGVVLNLVLMRVLGEHGHSHGGHSHGGHSHGGHSHGGHSHGGHGHGHGHGHARAHVQADGRESASSGSARAGDDVGLAPVIHHAPGEHSHAHGTRAAGLERSAASDDAPSSRAGHRLATAHAGPATGYAIDRTRASQPAAPVRATLVTSPAALTERSHGHDHGHDQGHDDGHDHGHDHACGHTAGPAGGAHAHGDEGDSSDDDHAHGHAARGGAGGPKQSVAMQAALAHVIGDLIQSLGVVLAAGLIWGLHDRWPDARGLSHWYRADPVCTLFSALLVLLSTWATIKECTLVLMCAVPGHIDAGAVYTKLLAIAGVIEVHDQHIWADAPDKLNLTAHIVVRPGVDGATVLYAAREVARQVGCQHTVFQVEDAAAFNCDPEGAWPCVARTQPAAP
ncbi:hypothetical protein KFE25_003473 [Diacronema lutheri]|uniref:Cation efflux protein transmembrane domain-containing protein n=3 Tax=Diacronema lutheri TaxID=2081491 RepID=A0A8J5XS40_DIALT|nr:hypothetical protein KFE25_003473 [Diacronema lutheri]